MKEHEKRFRIEFSVDVHNDGVTKEWDWSNDDIKEMALQELDCMSPLPFDITFSEVGTNWHTGTPTEAGLYVIAFRSGNKIEHEIREMFYSPDYGMTFGIKKDIVAYQKIEPYNVGASERNMTNLEYIRQATDKQLAELLANDVGHGDCYGCPNGLRCSDNGCESAWLEWLHDDYEKEDNCMDCSNYTETRTCKVGSNWHGKKCWNFFGK